MLKLSLRQQLQLALTGQVFLRWDKPAGYTDIVPIYAVKCKIHGIFEDNPHGHNQYFQCLKCLKEQQ